MTHRHHAPASRARKLARIALVIGVACAMAGCTYRREISRRGLLSNTPGAKRASDTPDGKKSSRDNDAITEDPDLGLRREDDRGNITLISHSARDVMIHVVTTLRDGEEELFLDQVLSKATTDEFHERGYDPVWAYRELKRREMHVRKLYTLMPYGEFTPGLFLKTVGRNVFRLSVRPSRGVPWTYVEVVIEGGSWKLRWFGP